MSTHIDSYPIKEGLVLNFKNKTGRFSSFGLYEAVYITYPTSSLAAAGVDAAATSQHPRLYAELEQAV